MFCLIRLLNQLWLRRRKPPTPPPVDPDLTYVTLAKGWPETVVERPWWCGAMEIVASYYTEEGFTEMRAHMNSGTRCKDCGKPLTERKVLVKLDVNPARAEWRHDRCPDTLLTR